MMGHQTFFPIHGIYRNWTDNSQQRFRIKKGEFPALICFSMKTLIYKLDGWKVGSFFIRRKKGNCMF